MEFSRCGLGHGTGSLASGLHDTSFQHITKCELDFCKVLYAGVVLPGGMTRFLGQQTPRTSFRYMLVNYFSVSAGEWDMLDRVSSFRFVCKCDGDIASLSAVSFLPSRVHGRRQYGEVVSHERVQQRTTDLQTLQLAEETVKMVGLAPRERVLMPASSIRGSLSLSATGSITVNALQLTANDITIVCLHRVASSSELRSRLLVDGMLCNGLTVFQLETLCHFDTRSVPRRTDYYGDDFRKTFPYSAPPTMASACAKETKPIRRLCALVSPSLPCASCRRIGRLGASRFLPAAGVGLLFAVASSTFLHSHKELAGFALESNMIANCSNMTVYVDVTFFAKLGEEVAKLHFPAFDTELNVLTQEQIIQVPRLKAFSRVRTAVSMAAWHARMTALSYTTECASPGASVPPASPVTSVTYLERPRAYSVSKG